MMFNAGGLFVGLCFFGPLLYVGLVMLRDPRGVIRIFERLAGTLRTLNGSMQGFPRYEAEPEPARDPVALRIFIQFAGAALVFYAVLRLAAIE